MHTQLFRAGATCFAAAALLAACSKPAPPEDPVRTVKVITVRVDNFQSGAEFAGEVRARIESQLGFRVAGKITQRNVEAGQRVKAGQTLAQLDPQDYRLAAEAARSAVSAAATNRNLAAADLKRYKELLEKNFIAGAEVERRQAVLDAAQSQLEQAQSQLASLRNQAGYANLVADVSGVITAVSGEPGQVVAAGTPVFRIAQDGPRDVVFSVPEDKLAAIKDCSNSKRFTKFIKIVLALGNFMNGRTARGGAYGFKLSTLTKLADTVPLVFCFVFLLSDIAFCRK